MKPFLFATLAALAFARVGAAQLRPPAVPLVTSDPYLSIWSEADKLTDDVTRHWTHAPQALTSLIRIDGQSFRLMGAEPAKLAALPQTGLQVTFTRSIYQFENNKVHVTLSFISPQLPNDLDVMTRPVTYLSWSVRSVDGNRHRVSVFDSASSDIAVNSLDQTVTCSQTVSQGLSILTAGSKVQSFLRPPGDDVRIDWGYLYTAMSAANGASAIGDAGSLQDAFIRSGRLAANAPLGSATTSPSAPNTAQTSSSRSRPVLAFSFDLGEVGAHSLSRHLMIGYDEIFDIDYFGQRLRPYWRRRGESMPSLLAKAEREYTSLCARCESFDSELATDAAQVGGENYSQILALAYRECIAGVGIAADAKGMPLLFTKENTSNGDIATVDVIFPMDPVWVLLNPTLAKASLVGILDYSASPHWKFPNAPHDLGTYPRAEGRDDGGEGMPVEESGNMLILADAIAHDDGNADFAKQWWPEFTKWAQYLEKYGLDPEDQLCTDDFMGHLAHNANLAVKAIVALGAYGDLCRIAGDSANAHKYLALARADAIHWTKVASDGDHSKLAFDQPGTWSQKYNLVWDRILGLNVFPANVAASEIEFYKSHLQPYGLPLDSRTRLTKTDWSLWSASLATEKADFQRFVDPIFGYLSTTSTRDPVADSYMTDDAGSGGMHARPVVGGFFVKMLTDRAIWKKWSSMNPVSSGAWAPLPLAPTLREVVPTARTSKVIWRYTTVRPPANWTDASFDDSHWQQGPAGFGTEGTPSAIVGTKWDSDDIWIRRSFAMPKFDPRKLRLIVYHDEDIEVFANGVLIGSEAGYDNSYKALELDSSALKALASHKIVTLAAHCHQTTGGQGIDVGFGELQYHQ